MRPPRSHLAFILTAALLCSAAAAEPLRSLLPHQRAGLRTWDTKYVSIVPSKDRQNVTFGYAVSFKNETVYELAEIDVRIYVTRGGAVIYRSASVPIRSFTNVGFGLKGSLLPYEKSLLAGPIPITIPSQLWTSDAGVDLEIADAKTFRGSVDLHDLSHLYSRMVGSPNAVLDLFKKDPSLLADRGSDGYDVSAAAYAACAPAVIKYVATHGGSWKPVTRSGMTNMHLAALNGWPGVLDLALAHGGKVSAQTRSGRRTPLYKAIRKGFPQNVTWLLKHGASANEQPFKGDYPIAYWAIYDGQAEAFTDLVKAGANRHFHDGSSFGWMHYATDNVPFMPDVLASGVPVDDCDRRTGFTPLMLAQMRGLQDATVWLLQHGADPRRKDVRGHTAYDYAKLGNTLHTDRFFRVLVQRYSTKG